MKPHLAPILFVEPQRHRLLRRDGGTAPVAYLPVAQSERKFNRAVMRKTTIVESKSDELPNCFRVHATYSIHRSRLLVETGELLMRISGLLVVLFPGSS
jgi:hypothetical protein